MFKQPVTPTDSNPCSSATTLVINYNNSSVIQHGKNPSKYELHYANNLHYCYRVQDSIWYVYYILLVEYQSNSFVL